MTSLILACSALFIFLLYNCFVLYYFKVPSSLSVSFYLWNSIKVNLGYIFTGMMFIISLLLMPAWIEITKNITQWSHYLTVLPFLGAGMIAFVGAAPAFRSCVLESKVHTISATAAAAFSLLWCVVVCYQIAWIILPLSLGIIWGIAFLTKTQKTASVYWWEMVAFAATFSTIIIECIKLL